MSSKDQMGKDVAAGFFTADPRHRTKARLAELINKHLAARSREAFQAGQIQMMERCRRQALCQSFLLRPVIITTMDEEYDG